MQDSETTLVLAPDLVLANARPVLAGEVWPAIFDAKPNPGEIKDQAQVRVAAETLAQMDDRGELAKAFAPPKDATPELIAQVEGEEGWILGV